MNRNHPLAGRRGVLLEQIQNEKWVDVGQDAGVFFAQVEDICRLANFSRAGNMVQQVPSFDLLKSMVRLGKEIAFIPDTLDLLQEPQLLLMPILNADGTPFKEITIRHVLIRRSERPKPLVLALSGLVKANTHTVKKCELWLMILGCQQVNCRTYTPIIHIKIRH